jgi:hypothetical protein
MRPGHVLASALVASLVVPLGATVAQAQAKPAGHPHGHKVPGHHHSNLQKESSGRGLTYDGLRAGLPGGPCDPGPGSEELLEIRKGRRVLGCTHGPDPAPHGVNLSSPATLAELRAGSVEQAAPISCIGDGTSGYRVQAVYAYPADRASRYASVAPMIQGWAASNVNDVVNNSAAETGAGRQVRFVTDAACQPVVLEVPLSAAGDDTFSNTISEMRALGYNRADRKYLVWMDPAGAAPYCGIGQLYLDDRPTYDNLNNGHSSVAGMFARVDAPCWGGSGTPVEAHELMHSLGGVQNSAPHSTGHYVAPAGGHCTDEYDVMCYDDDGNGPAAMTVICPSGHERRFDCGHDDYFHTSPPALSYLATHWNAANSRFLEAGGALPTGPANDHLADAQTLEGASVAVNGITFDATKETGEPAHAGSAGGASVWYRWQAPASGTVTIDTFGSAFDTVLGVYTGSSIGALAEVAANDDQAAPDVLTSKATFPVSAGTTYRVAVDGFEGEVGSLALRLTFGPGGAPRASLRLSPSRKVVAKGARVTLAGRAPSCGDLAGMHVELKAGGTFRDGRLNGACTTKFRVRIHRRATFRLFAVDEAGEVAAQSNRVAVRVRR